MARAGTAILICVSSVLPPRACSSPAVSDTSCRPSTGKRHSASLAAPQRNPQHLQLQHVLGSKRSSSASESPLHASAAGSGSKRRGGAGSTFPPDAAAAALAAEAEAKRDKEKNRQAQQRFRERQKELIQNLREEVGQLQKKVCAAHVWGAQLYWKAA